MNDEIERRLRSVSPLRASDELRPRVLEAVCEELGRSAPLPSRRLFRPGLTAAAVLFASVVLELWVNDRIDRRLAVVLGPQPVATAVSDIAINPDRVAGASGSQPVYPRLAVHRVGEDAGREYVVWLQHLIEQLTVDFKETADEAPRKNPQMDRDRRGSRDRHRSGGQRFLDLEHRNIA